MPTSFWILGDSSARNVTKVFKESNYGNQSFQTIPAKHLDIYEPIVHVFVQETSGKALLVIFQNALNTLNI